MSARNRIIEYLEERIATGRAREGDRLPTEARLAAMFDTTISTAHRALKDLATRGAVMANKRAGTAVTPTAATVVRSTMNSRKGPIRVLLPADARRSAYWVDAALNAFETATRDAGYRVLYGGIPDDADAWRKFIDARQGETGGALVLFSPTGKQRGLFLRCQDIIMGYPGEIYAISRGDVPFREYPWHAIVFDPYREGYVAGRFLARRGYARLVFLEAMNNWSKARFSGAREALKNNAPNPVEIQAMEAVDKTEPFEEALNDIRACHDKVCVLARNDYNAAKFLDFTRERGMDAPRDFDLVAFSDDPAFRHYNLTTVAAALDKCGDILADAILNNPFKSRNGARLLLRPEPVLIERETC